MGTCTFSSTGGSGGAGGGAGGGGGVAQVDQQLVSGSRLRAVAYVGTDGSRAAQVGDYASNPVFWDTVLNQFCSPMRNASGGAVTCFPIGAHTLAYAGPYNENAFGDAACSILLSRPTTDSDSLSADIQSLRTFTPLTTGTQSVGGSGLYAASQVHVGGVFYRNPRGSDCIAVGSSDGGQLRASGPELPMSELAAMPPVVE